jgi:amidase
VTLAGDRLGAFVPGSEVVVEPTASGPLDGLTFAVKDVFDLADVATGFGNPVWLATHAPAAATAPAVERLLAAGARLRGKTVTDELTYSLTGENAHYGTPVNPRCPERVPGGSSSGSAAAVAGGLCDLALGTDCAGSVRIPASYCGLYGMRPSHGRIPLDGVCPFAPSFDTAGWLARDPQVLELAGRELLRERGRPPPARRVLVATDAFALAHPATAEALAAPLATVCDAVGAATDVVVAQEGLERWMQCFRTIQGFEIWQSLGAWVREARPKLGAGVRERLAWASRIAAEAAEAERAVRASVRRRLEALLGEGDVLCLPTAPGPAPLRGAPALEVEEEVRYRAISLLCIAGLGGLPQVTLPLAQVDGCPVGLSLVAAAGADLLLLALAAQVADRCSV